MKSRWILAVLVLLITCGLVLWLKPDPELPMEEDLTAHGLRIVSLTPNVTEILFELGADEYLVGVSDYCEIPEGRQQPPRCGGLLDPNYERILSLKPHMIFVLGKTEKIHEFAEAHEIRAVSIEVDSFDQLLLAISRIGVMTGFDDEASELANRLRTEVFELRDSGSRQNSRTLIVLSRTPGSLNKIMTVGGTSYLSEMVGLGGGKNIFAGTSTPYFKASRESIKQFKPELIVELQPGQKMSSRIEDLKKDWISEEPSLPAVRNGNFLILTNEFLIPGPRMLLLAHEVREHLTSRSPANE
jgi:ABC-type Fe3+-hydroxamate transport system substrate-binding protein